jgi:putative heme-binding domain-containing protein
LRLCNKIRKAGITKTPTVTQVISQLDYTPAPETVTVTFAADAALELTVAGGKVERVSERESRLTVTATPQDRWLPATLTLATPVKRLDVAFTTTRDGHRRVLGTQRFLMPFATPAPPPGGPREVPELAGGNWRAGHELFVGKAACATCHQLRGEGQQVGPDLGNVMHRDYASVLKDIMEPSAAINPDAIGYTVTRKDGTAVTGTRVGETEKVLKIAQPGGVVVEIAKDVVVKSEPLTASLMPAGLDKVLTPEELRDLMTYLLRPAPLPVK